MVRLMAMLSVINTVVVILLCPQASAKPTYNGFSSAGFVFMFILS